MPSKSLLRLSEITALLDLPIDVKQIRIHQIQRNQDKDTTDFT